MVAEQTLRAQEFPETIAPPMANAFGDLPLGASFDELFATLLPQYSADPVDSARHDELPGDLFEMDWLEM